MAKLRNITEHALETRLAGARYTTEPDAVLEVPDDVYQAYLWPETQWAEVEVPQKPKDPDDITEGSIPDVLHRVGDDKTLAAEALAAEKAKDNPRSTLVERLTDITEG